MRTGLWLLVMGFAGGAAGCNVVLGLNSRHVDDSDWDASGDGASPPTSEAGVDAQGGDGSPGGIEAGAEGGSDATPADAGHDGGGDAAASETGVDAGYDGGYDSGIDSGLDSGYDGGIDSGIDSGLDAGRDAGFDSGYDAGYDGGYDSGIDSGLDSGYDGGIDSGIDSGLDAGRDAGFDSGYDAGYDGGYDAGYDAGFDAGYDSGFDSGVDAGYDAGPPRCLVDAGVFTTGQPNPSNPCQICEPGSGVVSTWSSTREGLSCDVTGGSCVSGSCLDPMSCRTRGAGMTNCGASGTDNCCTSLEVDGGVEPYDRSYPDNGNGQTLGDPATVSSFRLDKYLVTVGRFRQFVTAWNNGAWTPDAGSGKHIYLYGGSGLIEGGGGTPAVYEPGWSAADDPNIAPTGANLACGGGLGASGTYSTWTVDAGAQENLPVNCVEWAEAYAFCIWDGAFLPSEAEWEYAAAGGTQQLEYPWGDAGGTAPTAQYAIYNDNYPSPLTGAVQYIAPVGTAVLGVGTWGQLDMAGELWEWNLDWYAGYASPCINCANTTVASYRVVRGGLFNGFATYLLPPYRFYNAPTNRYYGIGFRCARTP